MKAMPIAYVAPADKVGIATMLTAVPMTGTLFTMLVAPSTLVAGIIDPARPAMSAFAKVLGKRNIINPRDAAKHLDLDPADGSKVDERQRNKTGGPRPQ